MRALPRFCEATPPPSVEMMIESHASERDDYEITVPETDALVEAAVMAGALGARQTGGGWGGAVVALVAEDRIEGGARR